MNIQNIMKLMSILLEKIENKDIKVKYVRTEEQLADFLTKTTPRRKLLDAFSKLGIVDV